MATRKWIAADGSQHDSAGAADAHDEVHGFASKLLETGLASSEQNAADLFAYFSANFRVPKTRAKRTPKVAATATEAAAAPAAKPAKVK